MVTKVLYIFIINKILIIFILCSIHLFAQKVYSVDYEKQADVKVFVSIYESQADLIVCKVDYVSQSSNNDGNWFFVD